MRGSNPPRIFAGTMLAQPIILTAYSAQSGEPVPLPYVLWCAPPVCEARGHHGFEGDFGIGTWFMKRPPNERAARICIYYAGLGSDQLARTNWLAPAEEPRPPCNGRPSIPGQYSISTGGSLDRLVLAGQRHVGKRCERVAGLTEG